MAARVATRQTTLLRTEVHEYTTGGKIVDLEVFDQEMQAIIKGVEGQFKALEFVSSVKTNLEAASFDLKFKPGKQIKINKIWDAVDDGGFTVGNISVDASGTLVSSGGNYVLQTGNSPDLKLANVTGDFTEGDKVSIKGNITTSYSVSVNSIRKL